MEKFVIEGENKLSGTVIPQGNKNEALPVLASVILTEEEVVLKNLPQISDVLKMIDILKGIGVKVKKLGDNEYSFIAKNITSYSLDEGLARSLRGSLTLAGSLLGRCKQVLLPKPGGDRIGRRRIDTHLLALQSLGATISGSGPYEMFAENGLIGSDILLDEASVTGTENAIMASVLAKGTTTIRNAASEPHVQQLCKHLNNCGAKISGIGSNILRIDGVERLHGGTHTILADYLEVGSFIGLAAVTDSDIRIKNAGVEHLRMILMIFERLGIKVKIEGDDVIIPPGQSMEIEYDFHGEIPKVDDAPWPGFPADMLSVALVVATQCKGTVLLFEKMYESRLFFVDKLISMGARIVLCDPHRAVIIGPSQLYGSPLSSPDIRAGIALLIAALCAKGKSVIYNIKQIDRGYEKIDERLKQLGANIQRVTE